MVSKSTDGGLWSADQETGPDSVDEMPKNTVVVFVLCSNRCSTPLEDLVPRMERLVDNGSAEGLVFLWSAESKSNGLKIQCAWDLSFGL
ncbi:hypothetical protein GH714_039110 [Hevea brasiliensis]|uniref:Uncharacterized protein n=1 Tax=Hevea brasiliensis TaxID=3981 RepID=A0A6A6MQU2_HEVBR|nr:hypothetical protein GH714_039110 [Hevea brasiliensis]